ncbi:hypothetical protein EV1_038485 [Malus domestica]
MIFRPFQVYSGGGIAEELGNLIQLRKLEVMDVAEENTNELLASITKMSEILSLSLEAKDAVSEGDLILPDSFTPTISSKVLPGRHPRKATYLVWLLGKAYKSNIRQLSYVR